MMDAAWFDANVFGICRADDLPHTPTCAAITEPLHRWDPMGARRQTV